jgi:hypothetical protein
LAPPQKQTQKKQKQAQTAMMRANAHCCQSPVAGTVGAVAGVRRPKKSMRGNTKVKKKKKKKTKKKKKKNMSRRRKTSAGLMWLTEEWR